MRDWAALTVPQREALDRIAEIMGVERESVPADASMNSFPKWDSYVQIEIMLFLEEKKDIETSEESIIKYSNISEILSIF